MAISPSNPIERFLGPDLDERGPFVLLGLDPSRIADADRLVPPLLEARLMRINSHPQARTPEADQVRLAVHAAAAQLLNPASRAAQLRQWHPEFTPIEVVNDQPGASTPPSMPPNLAPDQSRADQSRADQARTVMAMHGGWNRDSMLALAALSAQSGASLQEVAQSALTRGTPASPVPVARPAPIVSRQSIDPAQASQPSPVDPPLPTETLPDQVDPAYRKLQSGVRLGGIGCATVVLVSVIGFAATRCESTKVNPKPVAENTPTPPVREQDRPALPGTLFATPAEREAAVPRAAAPSPAPANASAPGDAQALLARVREVRRASVADPAAASAQLAAVIQQGGSAWAAWQPDEVAAFTDGLVDAAYALSKDQDLGRGVVDALMAATVWRQGAEARELAPRVWPSVFAAGALARLSRERDLPAGVRSAVNTELTRISTNLSESTFEAGARTGLQSVAGMLSAVRGATTSITDLGPAWGKWADAALAVAGGTAAPDPSRRALAVLVPLEDFLRTGPDPNADKQAFESIQTIVSRLDFSTNGPPREWLLRWLVSPEISSGRLFALTSRLAQEPARTGGIDASMVVPSAANENLRADLRDRYSKAWGIVSSQDADALRADWVAWTREFLMDQTTPQSPAISLAGAVAAARINEAAWLMWTGEPERASRALDRRMEPAALAQKAMEAVRPDSILDPGPPDGEWGARYLAASLVEKRELLNAVGSDAGVVGPRDCFVLVSEMTKGQSVPIRASARDRVKFLGGQAPMISVLLDQVGTLPRTREITELIDFVTLSVLPSADDPRWREYARRALVDRLLGVIAASGEFGVIDTLAEQLGEAYQVRGGVAGGASVLSPEEAAGRLASRMIKVAETLPATGREHATLAEITQRLTARQDREKSSSTGRIRVFLATQMACFELTAYTMVTEDPTRESAVKEIAARVAQNWSGAGSSLDQARICERGLCELWMLRFGPAAKGESK